MEFWYRVLGGDVIRREAILELVQSGCYQEYRKGLQVFVFSKVDIMACTALCFLLNTDYLVKIRKIIDLQCYKMTCNTVDFIVVRFEVLTMMGIKITVF
jgi:hypothetical protein